MDYSRMYSRPQITEQPQIKEKETMSKIGYFKKNTQGAGMPLAHCKMGAKWKKKRMKTENGDITDHLGSLIVMVFLFAVLFALIGYSQLVMLRLDIDHTAKNYLHVMEEYGFLPTDADIAAHPEIVPEGTPTKEDLITDLSNLGVEVLDMPGFEGTQFIDKQVAYGDTVNLDVAVEFTNPLWKMIGESDDREAMDWDGNGNEVGTGKKKTMFISKLFEEKIDYQIKMKTTSKW